MIYQNLKEKPKLVLEFPEGDVTLTRRHVPASKIAEHDAKLKALNEKLQNGEISHIDFVPAYIDIVCEDYNPVIMDRIDGNDITSLLNAVRSLVNHTRQVSITEKKTG